MPHHCSKTSPIEWSGCRSEQCALIKKGTDRRVAAGKACSRERGVDRGAGFPPHPSRIAFFFCFKLPPFAQGYGGQASGDFFFIGDRYRDRDRDRFFKNLRRKTSIAIPIPIPTGKQGHCLLATRCLNRMNRFFVFAVLPAGIFQRPASLRKDRHSLRQPNRSWPPGPRPGPGPRPERQTPPRCSGSGSAPPHQWKKARPR